MHIGVRRKFLVGFQTAIVVGALAVLACWPESRVPILVLAGLSLLAGWAVAAISNWWLHHSISRLRRAADAIGRGDLSKRVEVLPGDEIAKLARAFNQMADRLESTAKEERRLQEQLMRSGKLAVIGELAATVAHEVNNPLDGMQNCSRLIRRSIEDPQRVRRLLDLMDTGFYRIEMIVRRLLTLARDDAPQIKVVRLDEPINEAIMFLEPKIARREIEFVRQLGDRPVWLKADPQQITQVMINLILNAIDSMPEGGRLSVVVREPDPERRTVRIEVSDTGSGIPEQQQKKIFEPFFTTKEPGSGTGLGLTVVARIVKAHNGTVAVNSVPGQGTTFTVELPTADTPDEGGETVALPRAEGMEWISR
jgi:signal transduction histidine kinase